MIILLTLCVIGIIAAGLVEKNIPTFFRILIFPSLIIIIFTQILLFLGFLIGINWISILCSLIVLIGILLYLIFKRRKLTYSSLKISIDFLIIAIPTVIIASILYSGFVLNEGANGLSSGGRGLYGDSALHAAYTSRLATGEFPPQNPLFAGKTLVYPFAVNLFAAVLLKSGLNFNLAFSLPQLIFIISLLSIFYLVCKSIGSTKIFFISSALIFLGWGTAGLQYIIDNNNLFSMFNYLDFDSIISANYNLHFFNIFSSLIFPARSFLPGLIIGISIYFLFKKYFETNEAKNLIAIGSLTGILPYWHTHTAIFIAISGIIFGVYMLYNQKLKIDLISIFGSFAVSIIFVSPFLFLFFTNQETGQFLRFISGWQNGNENILLFWFKNSFLILPLATAGFFIIEKKFRIFFIPSAVTFIVANLIIFQPWEWDNIKLLTWSFVFFAILASFALIRILRFGILGWIIVVAITLTSSLTGFISITDLFKRNFVIYDLNDIKLAGWVKENTTYDEIFAVDPLPNHPVPGLSGRVVYLGYPGHLWVHGIDYEDRQKINNEIISGNISNINKLDTYISYIVTSKQNVNFPLKVLFENDKWKVYKTNIY